MRIGCSLARVRVSAGVLARMLAAPMLAMLLAASCGVHEWPDESTPAQLEIEMVFAQDMPDYKEVDYDTRKTKTEYTSEDLDIRYTLKFYPELPGGGYSGSEATDYTEVLTRPATEGLDCSFTVTLPEGRWQVRCWADYVVKGSVDDLFYETADFSAITVMEDYMANTDYKDAFRGSAEVSVHRVGQEQEPDKVSLEMERPLAKFRFIATDFDLLITKIMREREAAAGSSSSATATIPVKSFNPEDYYIRFYYTSFLPCVFNMFKDKPIDSRTGDSFDSEFIPLSDKEVLMGFDYVLVNGHESGVYVEVALYDRKTDNLLSLTPSLLVPLVRSKVTTVSGDFLTMGVGSGIGVNPSFEEDRDEFIIRIP